MPSNFSGVWKLADVQAMIAAGTWDGIAPSFAEYLVVGGGGAGGRIMGSGGGGGAGGVRQGILSLTKGTTYTVTIGAGGADQNPPVAGSDSVLGPITAVGGGCGISAGEPIRAGNTGGSGGGHAYGAGTYLGVGADGIPGQGNRGGHGQLTTASPYRGGGGGGAGSPGRDATDGANSAGDGGAGIASDISGTLTTYGGGGGGHTTAGLPVAFGGAGGGGAGGSDSAGTAGTANTGGGGGGGNAAGGTGGSGVGFLRYPASFAALTSTTGSPTITVTDDWRIYKWTSSGTFVP